MARAGFRFVALLGRLFVFLPISWLIGTTTAHAVTQGDWVSTGQPVDTLATGGSLIVLADGTPLLFGLDVGGVQQLTLQNTGGPTLTGSATTSAPFVVVSGSPFSIASGGSATLTVELTAPGFGTFTGALQFTSNGNAPTVPMTASYLDLNGNGQWDGCGVDACVGFGLTGDHPVVGNR